MYVQRDWDAAKLNMKTRQTPNGVGGTNRNTAIFIFTFGRI